ncbi:hypothetical protein RFI_15287 [Reticulomyxa filosa]|uniref:Myotubularin phosphatase domain-containing protein n=1 Tax=Reticulomyxa filosa TaxID=46433 RepID=X6N9F2_RETFI|nr:hypothetical protein RFI_15287 [Reticulomyxa filosa]|eukprot:ETO21917.1 hypothetical protein RFI_15287 [Reticulomyxa filosa]
MAMGTSSKDFYDRIIGGEDHWISEMAGCSWLNYVRSILATSIAIVSMIHLEQKSVLVHCSDGWDRTSQLCSIAQILLDPYFRTIKGLCVLIEKDWISFGHKFRERFGHFDEDGERSPVFLQFLDCLYQLVRQFPTIFEYNVNLLNFIGYHVTSCRFGTFLANNERERISMKLHCKTPSIWSYIFECVQREQSHSLSSSSTCCYLSEQFVNHQYKPCLDVLFPDHRAIQLSLWPFYLRADPFPSATVPTSDSTVSPHTPYFQSLESMLIDNQTFYQSQQSQLNRHLYRAQQQLDQLKKGKIKT